MFANFPDEQLSLAWPMQCEAAVESLHAAMEADSAASSAAPRTPVGRPMFSVNVLDSPDMQSLQPMLEIESSPEPLPKRARHSESTSDSKDWDWHFIKKLNKYHVIVSATCQVLRCDLSRSLFSLVQRFWKIGGLGRLLLAARRHRPLLPMSRRR